VHQKTHTLEFCRIAPIHHRLGMSTGLVTAAVRLTCVNLNNTLCDNLATSAQGCSMSFKGLSSWFRLFFTYLKLVHSALELPLFSLVPRIEPIKRQRIFKTAAIALSISSDVSRSILQDANVTVPAMGLSRMSPMGMPSVVTGEGTPHEPRKGFEISRASPAGTMALPAATNV
jgi:hypothetical protein